MMGSANTLIMASKRLSIQSNMNNMNNEIDKRPHETNFHVYYYACSCSGIWQCKQLVLLQIINSLEEFKVQPQIASVIHKTVGLLMVEVLYSPNLILVYLVLHIISQIWQYTRKEVSPALASQWYECCTQKI